jgi:hypothetical protein
MRCYGSRVNQRVRILEDPCDLAVATLNEKEVVVPIALLGRRDDVVAAYFRYDEVWIDGRNESLDLVAHGGKRSPDPVEDIRHSGETRGDGTLMAVGGCFKNDVRAETGKPGRAVTDILGLEHPAIELAVDSTLTVLGSRHNEAPIVPTNHSSCRRRATIRIGNI